MLFKCQLGFVSQCHSVKNRKKSIKIEQSHFFKIYFGHHDVQNNTISFKLKESCKYLKVY